MAEYISINGKEPTWKPVDGFNGIEASDNGKVRNSSTMLNVKEYFDKDGYKIFHIKLNGKQRTRKIHRMIATAFIPNPENKPTVNHINGVKNDNRVENLEWATSRENTAHAFAAGLMKVRSMGNAPNKKLSSSDVLIIKQRVCSGDALVEIAKDFCVSKTNIQHIKQGRTWNNI